MIYHELPAFGGPIGSSPISGVSISSEIARTESYGGVIISGLIIFDSDSDETTTVDVIEYLKASSLLIMGIRRDFRVTIRPINKHSSSMFQDRISPLERL